MEPKSSENGNGSLLFGGGLASLALGLYLLLDSVRVVSGGYGWISGAIGRGHRALETTSMGVIFVPFLVGVGMVFYDAKMKLGWWLSGLGLIVVLIEIFSRIRFVMEVKTTHLLMILILIAAGAGMMLKGAIEGKKKSK